ncbi:unnamed protein product [Trichobilharzia regenti]|nr:unnamed protein product [Trichobilharzia regenti]
MCVVGAYLLLIVSNFFTSFLQVSGIRFLYDNVVESVKRFQTTEGFGCILAHSMGLGKTIQIIGFLDILFRFCQAQRVLVIVPINTIQVCSQKLYSITY